MTQTDLQLSGSQNVAVSGNLLDRFVSALSAKSGGLPAHVALANMRQDLTPARRMVMMSSYTGGDIIKISELKSKVFRVIGATVLEHGAFSSMKDGSEKDGYAKILIKTSKTETREEIVDGKVRKISVNVIISSSSNGVNDFFLGMIRADQPMDFKEPFNILITGSQSTGYQIFTLDEEDDPRLATTIEAMQNP